MELDYYLKALRRGWLRVMLAAIVGAAIGVGYLAIAPKTYDATARVVVAVNDPTSIPDAQSGAQFVSSMASTVAAMIDSPIVLEPAAESLDGAHSASALASMVTVATETSTGLLTLTVRTDDGQVAADVATAVAESASDIVPEQVGGTNSEGDDLIRVDVLSTPDAPTSPTSPSTKGVMVIATLIGLTVGLALAIAAYAADRRVRRPEDFRSVGTPVLAAIPGEPKAFAGTLQLDDRTAAAYQALRTAVSASSNGARSSTLVAPLTPGNHDADVPARLAAAYARAGRRTLVIDLDARSTALASVLDLPEAPGVFEVLAGGATPDEATVESSEPGVWAMRPGEPQGSPADALAGQMLEPLLQWAEASFDTVVLTAPAVLDRPDASVVAARIGRVVIAVKSGKDDADALQQGLDTLASAHGAVLGVALLEPPRRH
ncbi:Wzz/FepE/Etk N-terminal domain-containing protein [Demequina salsinemoris]|uniref:Wzz/FepE/Etk N-terminal domain-containing protein n=1 Tax=Demequina salsinemoris TaxID=577470 RepID=UPI0007853330|nr:Wzz/FepE/Etk N-terminal domain-containing protein [Demequina salsinemoris]